MITPEEFPYITSIYVNDCYAYQNFNIDLVKHQPFSHLILTGKNGSGKSTILRALDKHIASSINDVYLDESISEAKNEIKKLTEKKLLLLGEALTKRSNLKKFVDEYGKLSPKFSDDFLLSNYKKESIYSYLLPYRNSKVNKVEIPTKQDEFEKQLEQNTNSSDFFIKNFKQFLVNKKVNQAFAQLEKNKAQIESTDAFFHQIENIFGQIFEDNDLKLVFEKDAYEFLIKLSDGREVTFDILPDGFSAFLSILMDLFTRLDLIRKAVGDFTYNPCGIVLIDEPETHLHLSLQYQVLPILTTLFPNIQFIVATHSPAVISSILNVTVFDLTSKETLSDEAVGKSFSEMPITLETERLILRQFTLEDAPFMLELLNTPTWLQYIGDRNVHTIEEAENYLRNGSLKSYAENGFGFYAVIEKPETSDRSSKIIGMCGLVKRDTLPDIDIGFAFLPDLIGKGYGYEAASATLDYVLNVLKIKRLIAIVNADNEKSIGLVKKIGMTFERMITHGNEEKELMLFGVER